MCSLVSTKVGHFISFLLSFLTPDLKFCILGALMGNKSFVESFMPKVLHEDLVMIFCLLMLANPKVTFVMFSLCYA
jgi:hypothetical protein